MAIGDVKLRGQRQQYQVDRVSGPYQQAVQNLANAIGGVGDTVRLYVKAEEERQEKAAKFDANVGLAELRGNLHRAQVGLTNEAPASGAGITEGFYDEARRAGEDFLNSLPEELRKEYAAQVETAIQTGTTVAYGAEYEARLGYDVTQFSKLVDDYSSQIMAGTMDRDTALNELQVQISNTMLGEAGQADLYAKAASQIYKVAFDRAMENVAASSVSGRPETAPDLADVTGYMSDRGYPLYSHNTHVEIGTSDARPGPEIMSLAPRALEDVIGPGGKVVLTSGVREGGRDPSGRHSTGLTGDFVFYRQDGSRIKPTDPEMAQIALAAAARGAQGIGFGEEYMRGMHIDFVGTEAGGGHFWASGAEAISGELLKLMKEQPWLEGALPINHIPDVWTDPAFDGADFATKAAMAASAATMLEAQRKAAIEQQNTFTDSLLAEIALGSAGMAEVDAAIALDRIPRKRIPEVLGKVEDERAAIQAAQTFDKAVTGQQPLPNSLDNQAGMMEYLKRTGISAGLQNLDADAQAAVVQAFGSTGVMAEELVNSLGALARSQDPQKQLYGLNTLALMQKRNPNAFVSGVDEATFNLASQWEVLQRYTPADEMPGALARFADLRTPEGRQLAQERKALADEILEGMSEQDILKQFKTGMAILPGQQVPDMPATPGAVAKFSSDYTTLFKEFYTQLGDERMAAEATVGAMKQKWGPDEVGGTKRLTYLGPTSRRSNYYGVGGFETPEEVREDIITTLGIPEDEVFETVTDAQSEAEAARGEPASFYIYRFRDDPQYGRLFGPVLRKDVESGPWPAEGSVGDEPLRFRPTPSEEITESRKINQRLEVLDTLIKHESFKTLDELPVEQDVTEPLDVTETGPPMTPKLEVLIAERDKLQQQQEVLKLRQRVKKQERIVEQLSMDPVLQQAAEVVLESLVRELQMLEEID